MQIHLHEKQHHSILYVAFYHTRYVVYPWPIHKTPLASGTSGRTDVEGSKQANPGKAIGDPLKPEEVVHAPDRLDTLSHKRSTP